MFTLTLASFDTHQNQPNLHANLLRQLAEGLVALRSALTKLGAWDRTLVMTFSGFGRRPRQNQGSGTDHGTAAPHFVAGGAVRGGLSGRAGDLSRLDAEQNLVFTTDSASWMRPSGLVGRESRERGARPFRAAALPET